MALKWIGNLYKFVYQSFPISPPPPQFNGSFTEQIHSSSCRIHLQSRKRYRGYLNFLRSVFLFSFPNNPLNCSLTMNTTTFLANHILIAKLSKKTSCEYHLISRPKTWIYWFKMLHENMGDDKSPMPHLMSFTNWLSNFFTNATNKNPPFPFS